MRRLMTMAVCTAVLAACGSSSESANTGTGAATTSPTPSTTTVVPTTGVATTMAPTTVAPTTVAPTTVAPTTVAETTTTAPAAGLIALAIETAGEQVALDTAATATGRGWAMGDPTGTAMAVGDPFLVGYEVLLHDGVTQHQVMVQGETVVSYFGGASDLFDIPGPIADMWKAVTPETPRQQAAVDAARASLVATAPGAINGGILAYRVAFPATESVTGAVQYPVVTVFAVAPDPAALFTHGGLEIR